MVPALSLDLRHLLVDLRLRLVVVAVVVLLLLAPRLFWKELAWTSCCECVDFGG